MVLFTVTDYALVNATYPAEGIRMRMTLKRKIMSEMMTTYLPSALLIAITFATTFFKPFWQNYTLLEQKGMIFDIFINC